MSVTDLIGLKSEKLSFEGKLENVFDLLQGQITADLKKLENTDFILSCLCNEKGYILCDFLVTLSKKNF